MRAPLWIVLRHLAAMRRNSFLGRVSLLAMLGVGIGVGTLLTVLAFVQGFQGEVRELLTGMNPSLFISSAGEGDIDPCGDLLLSLEEREGVRAVGPFVQQRGVLSRPGPSGLRLAGVILRGVDGQIEREVTRVLDSARPPFEGFANMGGRPGLLLASRLARELGAIPGETVTFTTLLGEGTEPVHREFFVQGLVETGLYEFDRRFAYMDLGTAASLFRDGGGADGLGVALDDPLDARELSAELRAELPYPPFRVADWMDLNGEVFRWMGTMRAILLVSLSLIVLVAGFNIAGTMTIVVSEKTREIGLLRSLGASRRSILALYVLEGWLLGLGGVLLGLLLTALVFVIFRGRPLSLPGEVYFIDHMPMQLGAGLVALVAGVAVIIALASALFPGMEALRRQPLDALQGGGRIRG